MELGLCLGMKKNLYGQSDGSLGLIWEVNYSTVIFTSLTTAIVTIETSVGSIWPFYTWFTLLYTTLVETDETSVVQFLVPNCYSTDETRFGQFSATNWKWSQGSKVLFKAWDKTNTGGHFLLVITRSKGLAVCSHMDSNFAPRFPTFWVISNHELHWSILRRIRTWPEWKSISRWIRTWQECIATWTDWTNAPSIGSLSCVG